MAVLERLARTARSWRRIPFLKTLIPSRAPSDEKHPGEYLIVGLTGAGLGFVGAEALRAYISEQMVAQYAKLTDSELREICELARLSGGRSLPYLSGTDIFKLVQLTKQAGLIQGQATNNEEQVQKECHE